jgi:hypothetical protein
VKKPPVWVVAALVEARRTQGRVTGKDGYDAWCLGLVEQTAHGYELNLRGQDIADEAIALAAKGARR